MARKARQRISYVLPLGDAAGGHRLGVNGLAIDSDHSLLYSGGRDGVICAWDLNLDLRKRHAPVASTSDAKPPAPPATSFRQQVQAHTHWINDIALAHSNQALLSASSDITVKLWRPFAQDALPPQTIGLHSDYVKVLAVPSPAADWAASGGLDRKICLWDLAGAGQTLSIDIASDEGGTGNVDKGSVYALGATHSILASGGPESTIRVWDPRTGKRVTKFVGHTDNIRDILISDDGSTILTASSDQTVKVWSVTAGRCMYTMTMHDSSVWALSSSHPNLSIFYSADKTGLIAKTDTRDYSDLDDGLSVAICQESEGVRKLVSGGDYIWTATSRPSIHRWLDVDIEAAEIAMPDIAKHHGLTITTTRSRISSPQEPRSPQSPFLPAMVTGNKQIPLKHILRLSNTSYLPAAIVRSLDYRRRSTVDNINTSNGDSELPVMEPYRSQPESLIEGQNGLSKHIMLNDRKRVLTVDTAGEVTLWDLLKCVPIKSFGKRHLDDVRPEVDTLETVANWCSVDTRTGSLAVSLEEHDCFDAEMYADELDLDGTSQFKEDQRINIGKWVLRYLFADLITEEIRRDQQYRKYLLNQHHQQRIERTNAPTSIQMPSSQPNGWYANSTGPTSAATLRPTNSLPKTPGLGIMQATPMPFGSTQTRNIRTSMSEDGAPLEKRNSLQSQFRKSIDRSDYFSAAPLPGAGLASPGAEGRPSMTPGGTQLEEPSTPTADDARDTPSKFGKKFRMSFGMKKPAKPQAVESKPAVVEERNEDEGDSRSSKTSHSREVQDNLFGRLQKIRHQYEEELQTQAQRQSAIDAAGGALGHAKDSELQTGITPSLPSETPVLRIPAKTIILIQEDRPEAGGVADLFEGRVGATCEAADMIEKVGPMWLGDVLLRNQMPLKDIVKISFVLEPWQNQLPSIAADGNNRLNANRMLRARKILGYIAERIEPASADDGAEDPRDDTERPEEYLELWCQNQIVPPRMTLATIRAHLWRGGGDVLLYYKTNGRKQILHAPLDGQRLVQKQEQQRLPQIGQAY